DPPASAKSGPLEDTRGSAPHLAKETGEKAPKGRGDRSRRADEVAAGADPRTEALAADPRTEAPAADPRTEALVADPVAGALAATWLADAGRPRESALLWARIAAREEVWQADLAAVDGFLAALDRDGPAAGAGLAHGVALALAPSVHTPAVRRLRAVTAARSRWTRVLG